MAKPSSDSLRALWATTKEKIASVIKLSIIQNNALLYEIKEAGGLREVEDGGRDFNEPAIIGDSGAVGGFTRGQVLNVDEQGGIDAFEYSPARFYGTTHIYQDDLAMNAGQARAVNLLKSKIQQMNESVYNKLDEYLCGQNEDANGASTAAESGTQKGWLGLRNLIPDTATQDIPGTGVSKATYSKARSAVDSTAIATAAAWNTSNAGRTVVQGVYNATSFGMKKPKLMLATRTIWDAFQISLQANERFSDSGGKDAKVGYPHLMYMADCRVTWGDNVRAGHFYMINPEYLKFKVLSEANFKLGDFVEGYDVFQEVAKLLIMGQFCVSGPKYLGVYTGAAF